MTLCDTGPLVVLHESARDGHLRIRALMRQYRDVPYRPQKRFGNGDTGDSMFKETITIEVPPGTARAYAGASARDRERARQALVFALQPPGEATAELRRILDTIGAKARERGLTEETLGELLGGE